MGTQKTFRRVTFVSNGLIVSYCRKCGVIVAGSGKPENVALAERLHKCRVAQGKRATSAAQKAEDRSRLIA